MNIKNIKIMGDTAVVQMNESANGTTFDQSEILKEKGHLKSSSGSIYYLKKINDSWKIFSDIVVHEKTELTYGEANSLVFNLEAPAQIQAGEEYTASLHITPPKESFIIASIGREKVTYPQIPAKEIYKKFPNNGPLERMFKTNEDNLNEYAVASFGITKAKLNDGKELQIS